MKTQHPEVKIGTAGCTLLVFLSLLSMTVDSSASNQGLLQSEFIFESAPFPQCHASTIVETKQGLMAAWFGGTREKHPDVGIWMSQMTNGHWTQPLEVANGVESPAKRYPCWNPVLFQPKGGPLLLFYKVGPSPGAWWGMWMSSTNGGDTWSKPRRLPDGILGPIKNKPTQLANGDILCGSSTEDAGWQVHFERLRYAKEVWDFIGPVNDGKKIGAIQPSILFHADGSLQAVGRTGQGRVFEIWSGDQGATWNEMKLTSLPNPNAGTDAITMRDGRQCLVYNHCTNGRSPLNVAISTDGKRWQAALILENEPGQEFSYPAIIQSKDGLLHITYTWKRKRIKHTVLDPQQFSSKEMPAGAWPKTP